MAICYDLRFPGLFNQLRQQGANIVTLPSAFTKVTGKAHWQPLLQARAIENQCYLLAANQVGIHADDRHTWGHSMIVDAWGQVLACANDKQTIIDSPVDLTGLQQIRAKMPNLQHRRIQVSSSL